MIIFMYVGAGLWLSSYVYIAFFGMVSEYTGMMYRVKYLESVLKQDISWFENNDVQSLSSKISKEASAVQAATGEKLASIIFAGSMLVVGTFIGFILGWKFAFIVLGLTPIILVSGFILVTLLQFGHKTQERAFKKSSTLAEQALSSIKIVAAFGQENKEEERF